MTRKASKGKSERSHAAPRLGTVEWFRAGEHQHVEDVLARLAPLGIDTLRIGFSWAEYTTESGRAWYEWLMPRLAQAFDVLPCVTNTPPGLGREPKRNAPPRDPTAYADFLEELVERFGDGFEWVELWNEPNSIYGWDARQDPEWALFREMVGEAAVRLRRLGKKSVLGGMCPIDAGWLDRMGREGLLDQVDAVGIHGFPGTWEPDWSSWSEPVSDVQAVLDRWKSDAEIWITAGGYSTLQHDEFEQLRAFVKFASAPVSQAYWYSACDLPQQDGLQMDERHYHFGLLRSDGKPKLLYRIWAAGGVDEVRAIARLGASEQSADRLSLPVNYGVSGDGATLTLAAPRPSVQPVAGDGYVLITGGAGFVGTNVAHRLLAGGHRVRIFDNLSRPGVEQNLRWLREMHGNRVQVQIDDVRNAARLRQAVRGARQVYHFAAQVAVTTSVHNPVNDFEDNLRGTLNLLEALREMDEPPSLLFTSTNKVYGGLEDVALDELETRYAPSDPAILARGIGRNRPLEFHSPYGCSKGGADQYVLDYARIYGLPTVVFRMSCIYGPHQFGTEDQGWVAHFLIRAIQGDAITLFGDGKQVRDILFVEDLVDAMLLAQERIGDLSGQAYNIGGGPDNAVSLLELLDLIGTLRGEKPVMHLDAWRPGDQRYYVSDIGHFTDATGWRPRVAVPEGVRRLHEWLLETRGVPAPARLSA